MSSTHGYNLRSNVKSRVDKRVKEMVDAYGGPECVIGRPSATGQGVHLVFRSKSPKPSLSPRPRPSTRAQPKEDVEMVDSSESESGSSSDSDMDSSGSSSSSDTDTVEPNPPNGRYTRPSLPLRTPKPWRMEDLQPEGCQEASRRKVPSDREDVEAARRRVEARRLEEAKRIRIDQLQKQVRVAACQLRQRANDLEHETAEGAARLLREMEDTASTAMDEDEDGFDVRSNHSYTPTETSESSDDDEFWSSSPPLRFHTPTLQTRHIEEGSPTPTLPATPPPSQKGPQVPMEGRSKAQQGRPLGRQHAVAIPLASSPTLSLPGADTASFVVVTRQIVDGLNDLTGSPVRRSKRYRVHAADLESLYGDFDMEGV